MENIRRVEKRIGVDVGYHESNLQPQNRDGCVGKSGIDKTYTLEQVIRKANDMNPRPNIIIKAGKNAKWYLKRFPNNEIDVEIEKQKWRDTSRATMWIVEWD
jgi:hypothetical protein